MAETVYFANVTKRRNSTLQGTFSTSFDVVLKAPTSIDRPTFHISAASFDYNAAKWGNRYYFIDDVVSVGNGRWEVSCVLDVLATYKTEILASTQFVSYSSHNTSIWLPDTRIPLLSDAQSSSASAAVSLFSKTGFLVFSAVGEKGCFSYILNEGGVKMLLDQITQWGDDSADHIFNDFVYDFTSVETALQSIGEMMTRTGFLGNAYADAPNCIRSCIWVPFSPSFFSGGTATDPIYLGAFNTNLYAANCITGNVDTAFSVSIPWHYNDWRRAVCEDVYIYLPFVGMVNLSADSLAQETTITGRVSVTATDGVVCYELKAGSQVIGTYGGQCSANYPIGISQQASAGQLAQAAFAGAERVVNAAINSSISPLSAAGAAAGAALAGIDTKYTVENIRATRYNSCVGGIGGGAGAGLDFDIKCFTVSHGTSVAPADMAATMGRPTMQPMALATLTGFCQCANAHVAAPAQAQELDAIDRYLNGGFYIE